MMRAAALTLPIAFFACSHAEPAPRAPSPGRPSLSVMTYNLNFGASGDPAAAELIAREGTDLVLLQETTPVWESSLRGALADRYPFIAFHHCCGAGGLGVLSRHPIVASEVIAPPERGWFPAWRFELEAPSFRLQVLNVHLRPQISDSGSVVSGIFGTQPIRRAEIKKYFSELEPGLPTLVAGDFNEGHRGAALAFLRSQGFRSALYDARGSEPTWHWPTSLGTVDAQLDHIAHDPELEPLEARVVREGASDHFPVVAVFQLTKR